MLEKKAMGHGAWRRTEEAEKGGDPSER